MAETKQTISAREKWQQEVASTLQSDAITSGMFVNEMKQSFSAQSQFWGQQIQLSNMSNTLLESIEQNTFRTADLFEKYIDDFKDAARRQAEAALEASRKKDTKGGGKDIENIGGLDLDFGTIASGLIGGVGAAALGFKDKLINFFKGTETNLKDLDKPKKEWVETYQELNILAKICGHIDLWYEHYPFKKWVTHKYFPEVDMDNDDFPEGIFGEDDFCDQELIQEWIDETHQPFKLMSMPDQKGFYFYVSENNIVSTDKNKTDTNEVWSIDKGKWISLD